MNTKNDVEVIINGKQYTLSGYESSEYLQRIANHINDKLAEFRQSDGYARLDGDMKNILLAINLSDDYYKVQQRVEDLQKEKEDLEQEIFNIKHDMIEMKTLLEKRGEEIETLQRDKTESEHMVIRLETELEGAKAENSLVREQVAGNISSVLVSSGNENGNASAVPGSDDSNITEGSTALQDVNAEKSSADAVRNNRGDDGGNSPAETGVGNESSPDSTIVGSDSSLDSTMVSSISSSDSTVVVSGNILDSTIADSGNNLADAVATGSNIAAVSTDGDAGGATNAAGGVQPENSKNSNNYKKRHRRSGGRKK